MYIDIVKGLVIVGVVLEEVRVVSRECFVGVLRRRF